MSKTVESSLGFLSRLVDADALQQGLVEFALGVVLQVDAGASTQAFQFYRLQSPPSGVVKAVDLRVPVLESRAANAFLVLTIAPSDHLTATSLVAAYGAPLSIDVPTPQAAQGTGHAVTYVYRMGRRKVSFSFGPSPQQQLRSIALEAAKP